MQTTRLLYSTARQLYQYSIISGHHEQRVSSLFTHSGRSVVEAAGLYASVLYARCSEIWHPLMVLTVHGR